MKKILMSLVMMSVLLFGVVGVLGLDTTTFFKTRGSGTSDVSSASPINDSQSGEIYAPLIDEDTNEGTIRIKFPANYKLSNLSSISWMQNVLSGYASHVDVIIDTDNNGASDDALVFEYAKVDHLDCDNVTNYPTGLINTFGDKGIVDDSAYAWLNSGPPGVCGDASFIHKPLSQWKSENGTADILAIEIEVDGWISESNAYVDNIRINGELVEDFEEITIASNTQNARAVISSFTSVSITPATIDFGIVVPGSDDNPASENVVLDADGSNSDVNVAVTDVSGVPFDTGLMFDGALASGQDYTIDCIDSGDICTYDLRVIVPTLDVPLGIEQGEKTGVVTYTITGSTP